MYNYNYDILNIVLINSHLFIARMSVNANLESETVSMIKEKMLVKKNYSKILLINTRDMQLKASILTS